MVKWKEPFSSISLLLYIALPHFLWLKYDLVPITWPTFANGRSKVSRDTAFSTTLHWCPAKTQISLRIRAVWSESLQNTLWIDKDPKRLQADSEDFDQIVWMRRLIWVFAGRSCNVVENAVSRLTLLLPLANVGPDVLSNQKGLFRYTIYALERRTTHKSSWLESTTTARIIVYLEMGFNEKSRAERPSV